MKLMYEAFVDENSLGLFADMNAAQHRIEEELANDPPVLATIKLTYFGDQHEAIKPKRPTIADTGWRDEYRGMWAESGDSGRLYVLLSEAEDMVFTLSIRTYESTALPKDILIPRPDLAPVNFTPHPAYLETLEDYQNAPVDTIVGYKNGSLLYAKIDESLWAFTDSGGERYSTEIAGTRLRVLYWPEEQA